MPPGSNPSEQSLPRAGTKFASNGKGSRQTGGGKCATCAPEPAGVTVEAVGEPAVRRP